MSDVESDARFAVREPAVMWDEIGGEIVAINLGTGHYFSMRSTACAVFRLLAEGRSIGEIAVAFSGTPAQTPSGMPTHRSDLEELANFVGELLDSGLLEPVGAGAAAPVGELAAGSLDGYTTPKLETYTDLEDLMLLDPVHDVDGMGWPRARTEV